MAQIDPSIILQATARQPQFNQPDPIEQYGGILRLKALMGQGELQGLQLKQAQDEIGTNERLKGLFSSNPNATPDEVMAIDPKRGMQMRKDALEAEKTRTGIAKDKASTSKSEYDVQMGKLERGASLWSQAKDPQSFDAVLRAGELAEVFSPEAAAKIRAQGYSPELIQGLQNAGMTRAQQLKAEHDAGTLAQSRATAPFSAGPNGESVPNAPVQAFQMEKAKKSAPTVKVKTEVKTGESLGQQVGPMMKDSTSAAEGAVKQVDAAQRIIKAIDSDKVIAGPGATLRLKGAQLANMAGAGGKDDAERLANTRSTIRGLAELTLQGRQQMKGQGAITESEGALAQKAMSGDIDDLTTAEIKQLAKASERAARFNYTEHQRKLKVMQDNPDLRSVAPFYQGPAMSDEIPDAPRGTSDLRSKADAIIGGGRGNR